MQLLCGEVALTCHSLADRTSLSKMISSRDTPKEAAWLASRLASAGRPVFAGGRHVRLQGFSE